MPQKQEGVLQYLFLLRKATFPLGVRISAIPLQPSITAAETDPRQHREKEKRYKGLEGKKKL